MTESQKLYEIDFRFFVPQDGRVPVPARSPEEARNLFYEQMQGDPNTVILAITEIGEVTLHDKPERMELVPPSYDAPETKPTPENTINLNEARLTKASKKETEQ